MPRPSQRPTTTLTREMVHAAYHPHLGMKILEPVQRLQVLFHGGKKNPTPFKVGFPQLQLHHQSLDVFRCFGGGKELVSFRQLAVECVGIQFVFHNGVYQGANHEYIGILIR